MKKWMLGCLLFMGMAVGLFADSAADAQFKQYVDLTRKASSNPKGMTVASDEAYRIIYVAMPISLSSEDATPEVLAKMKTAMLTAMRQAAADCRIIKALKISVVYSYITVDKKIINIVLSYQDF